MTEEADLEYTPIPYGRDDIYMPRSEWDAMLAEGVKAARWAVRAQVVIDEARAVLDAAIADPDGPVDYPQLRLALKAFDEL